MKLYYNPEEDTKAEENITPHTLQGDNVAEESRDQRAKMKDRPFNEKLAYYVGYYKFHALGVLVVLIAIISIARAVLFHKDNCFSAMLINSVNISSDALSEGFANYATLDTKNYICYIDANGTESINNSPTVDLSTGTRFVAMISSADLDVAILDSTEFYLKGLNNIFIDLTTILPIEDINKYKDRFYYIDMADIRAAEENDTVKLDSNIAMDNYSSLLNDVKSHMDPSTMSEPIPVGIVLSDTNMITTTEAYNNLVPIYGIISNAPHPVEAVKFLEYITNDGVDFTPVRLYEY